MDKDSTPELYTIWDEAKNHIESGNYDKAIDIYKYVLIRYDDDDVAVEHANAYLGDLFLRLRQLSLAENHIKKALKYKPDNPAYHYILGFVYSIKRQWAKAIREFKLAVKKEPYNDEFLRGLGWAVFSNGDKTTGLVYLHEAINLAPTNVNILTDLASAYLFIADFVKARKYAKKAVKIAPENALAQEVLISVDDFEKKFGHGCQIFAK